MACSLGPTAALAVEPGVGLGCATEDLACVDEAIEVGREERRLLRLGAERINGQILDASGATLAVREDDGFGLYHYQVLISFDELQMRGGGEWEYSHQATFYDPASDPYRRDQSPLEYWDDPATAANDAEMEASRTETLRTDWLGRVWRLVRPRAQSNMDLPREELTNPTFGGEPLELVLDEPSASVPMGWSTVDCDGGWPAFAHHAIYGGESRIQTSYAYETQRATVVVRKNDGGEVGYCTGSIVFATDYLLTAGHCLVDDTWGFDLDPWDITVCTHGNDLQFAGAVTCSPAAGITTNPNYTGSATFGNDYSDDFGVVELQYDVVGGLDPFLVSNLGPSSWDNYWNRAIGYGGYLPGLPISCAANDIPNAMPWFHSGQEQYRQARSDLSFSAARVKTKFDGARGMSGGPFFYCPLSEDCNQSAQIIGIWTHWNPTSRRHSGPRANRFRQFVLDNLP